MNMRKKISIGIIGYGTVGSNTAAVLQKKNRFFADRTGIDFHIKKICDVNWDNKRDWMPPVSMRTISAL